MSDLVCVSWNEKGFWRADFFFDAAQYCGDDLEQMGLAPDNFMIMKRGTSEEDAVALASKQWP